jgi:hypothetical protein
MMHDDVAWYWGAVAAAIDGDAIRLRHVREEAELWVRNARLCRGAGYEAATREAKRELARVGAIVRLRARGRYFVHGAGLVDPIGRAFVLAGDSGAGKSTLAFALARSGWRVLGDDGVVLEAREHGVVAHAWRDPLRVSAEVFPELADAAAGVAVRGGTDDPRGRVRVWAPASRSAPVAAIVFVHRAQQRGLAVIEPLAALAHLVRQSPWVVMADSWSRRHLEALRHIAVTIPALEFAHTANDLRVASNLLTGWPLHARTA